jgi:hypothetical protein
LDDPDLSLENSAEPAPIDIVAFDRRLAEIITKAVRPRASGPNPESSRRLTDEYDRLPHSISCDPLNVFW